MMCRMNPLLFFGLLLVVGCSAREATFLGEDRSSGVKEEAKRDGEGKQFKQVGLVVGAAAPGDNAPAADKATPRKIIYTGLVDLIVDDFDQSEQKLRDLVKEHNGYLADSSIHNLPGSPRSGTWTVRVPTKHFGDFVQETLKLGEVRNRTTNSQDITDAYHDKAARLKADETEEKSLLALLEKTQGKVEDILKVREQLRIVRGHIEESKSQLQRWDKDVDLATVTVKLLDRRDYSPPLVPDFGSSVGRTFQGSLNALAAFGKGVVLTVVALAPWLVVLAVLGAPGFVMWRRRRVARARAQTAIVASFASETPPTPGDS